MGPVLRASWIDSKATDRDELPPDFAEYVRALNAVRAPGQTVAYALNPGGEASQGLATHLKRIEVAGHTGPVPPRLARAHRGAGARRHSRRRGQGRQAHRDRPRLELRGRFPGRLSRVEVGAWPGIQGRQRRPSSGACSSAPSPARPSTTNGTSPSGTTRTACPPSRRCRGRSGAVGTNASPVPASSPCSDEFVLGRSPAGELREAGRVPLAGRGPPVEGGGLHHPHAVVAGRGRGRHPSVALPVSKR